VVTGLETLAPKARNLALALARPKTAASSSGRGTGSARPNSEGM
jgi:hypothetical protein